MAEALVGFLLDLDGQLAGGRDHQQRGSACPDAAGEDVGEGGQQKGKRLATAWATHKLDLLSHETATFVGQVEPFP